MLHHMLRAAAGRGGFPLDNLKALWLFNEGAGSTADDYIGANDGTLTNTALWTPSGIIGSAIEGTGTSSHYIDLPSGANILGLNTTDTIFGFFGWFYADSVSAINTMLMLNKKNESSGFENVGAYFQVMDNSEVRFTIEEGNASGYGGQNNSNWGTGVFVNSGWNLIVCNRTNTSAKCVVRNSSGRTENTLSGSFGGMEFSNTSRGNRIGSYIADIQTLENGNRIDLMGAYDIEIDQDTEDQLWNSGNGLEP